MGEHVCRKFQTAKAIIRTDTEPHTLFKGKEAER